MLFLQMTKGNLSMWQWIILGIVLLPMTIKDIKKKEVNGYVCLIATLISLAIRCNLLGEANLKLLIDLAPGFFLMIIANCFKEVIGEGDALVVLFIGSVVGAMSVIAMMIYSLFVSAIICLVLLVARKVNKKTEIPFLPFLSLGVIAGGIM